MQKYKTVIFLTPSIVTVCLQKTSVAWLTSLFLHSHITSRFPHKEDICDGLYTDFKFLCEFVIFLSGKDKLL